MPSELVVDTQEPEHPLHRLLEELGAAFQFLRTGLRQIDKNASLFPSSRFLAEAMAAAVPLDHARCVVEMGPGTGVVTEAILRALPADAHLHAIELDGNLLETTTRRINDPRLIPVHGSAADARMHLQANGCRGASVVFSSLGLSLMNDPLREAILSGARQVLTRNGIFVQYLYPHARALTYQFGQGWSRFNGRAFLKGHFRSVHGKTVLLNAPPAVVFTCREPHRAGAAATTPIRDTGARRARRRRSGSSRRR